MNADQVWKDDVSKKLDRALNDLQFIKNRTSVYLGRNEVMTYLADETPLFVNSDDFGCPLNFMNGGLYEEDYFRVFLSFRASGFSMLDIGANLGVYSLRMAPYMRDSSIHAFEPIPRIRNLFSRSSYLNGYSGIINIHPFAVSDHSGTANLNVPNEHAGGASLEAGPATQSGISVDVKVLDDFFPEDFVCGPVKIDVEGHELHVLKGMRRILHRSSRGAVMFEKLSPWSGIESSLFDYFSELGWCVYRIVGRRLEEISLEEFSNEGGYFLASRKDNVSRDGLDRDFFDVNASDFNVLSGSVSDGEYSAKLDSLAGKVIFHGPYWSLPKGYYRLSFDGEVNSFFDLELCEQFGYKVCGFRIDKNNLSFEFPVYRDLSKFEFVLRGVGDEEFSLSMSKIRMYRIG